MKKTKKVKILPNENKKSENESFIPQTMTGTKPEDKQWFEKESFWQNFGPIMFDSQHWAEAPDVAENVIKIAGLTKGCSILDAGCGPGRISVELAALGLDVTGVDIIQSELDAAAETAEAEGVKLNLINADLRTFTTEKNLIVQ